MQAKEQFWAAFQNPVPSANLRRWPQGNLMQGWAESPELYATNIYKKFDDFSRAVCGHSGLDIATYHRAPIVAAHDGQVVQLRLDRTSLGGLAVYLKSDLFLDTDDGKPGYCITTYAHLDEIKVSEGQRIRAGELIGYMGNTGFVISGSTPYWGNAPAGVGTHCHFAYYEFNEDGTPNDRNCMQNSYDPLPIITFANPDYSGINLLLGNLVSYLKGLLLKLK